MTWKILCISLEDLTSKSDTNCALAGRLLVEFLTLKIESKLSISEAYSTTITYKYQVENKIYDPC